jgi:hypothetical protein
MDLKINLENMMLALSAVLFIIWILYAFGVSGALFIAAFSAFIAADYAGRFTRQKKNEGEGVDKKNEAAY